jgi:hypothetical protein
VLAKGFHHRGHGVTRGGAGPSPCLAAVTRLACRRNDKGLRLGFEVGHPASGASHSCAAKAQLYQRSIHTQLHYTPQPGVSTQRENDGSEKYNGSLVFEVLLTVKQVVDLDAR